MQYYRVTWMLLLLQSIQVTQGKTEEQTKMQRFYLSFTMKKHLRMVALYANMATLSHFTLF